MITTAGFGLAQYEVRQIKSATTTAATADTVTLSHTHPEVEVLHRGTSGTLWVRADGSVATVAGDECYAVQPYEAAILPVGPQPAQVSIISDEAVPYTVTGCAS